SKQHFRGRKLTETRRTDDLLWNAAHIAPCDRNGRRRLQNAVFGDRYTHVGMNYERCKPLRRVENHKLRMKSRPPALLDRIEADFKFVLLRAVVRTGFILLCPAKQFDAIIDRGGNSVLVSDQRKAIEIGCALIYGPSQKNRSTF